MSFESIKELAYNTSLLLVLGLVAIYVSKGWFFGNERSKILVGVLSGLVCNVVMINPIFVAGLATDSSFILIGVTAMFFGLEPALANLLIVIAGRLLMGGNEALSGIVIADFCAAAGLVWNKYRLQECTESGRSPWLEFAVMGIILAAAQQACLLVITNTGFTGGLVAGGLLTVAIYGLGAFFIFMAAFILIRTLKTEKSLTRNLRESIEENLCLTQELEQRDSLLRSLFDSITDLAFYKDTSSIYVDCNTSFENFTHRSRQEIVGLTDEDLFPAESAALHISSDMKVLTLGAPQTYEEQTKDRDGEDVVFETLNTPCVSRDGDIIGLIGISRDITERKRKEEEIRYLTYHDISTGLYNSNYFDLMRGVYCQSPPMPLSVIMCDLNGLKLINDAFGHTEGDKLLREAARLLMSCARPVDIIARIGGDEFCILLPDTDFSEVQAMADKIGAACQDFKGSIECPYSVNLALGYATGAAGETVDQIFKTAEDFMNKKKMLDLQSIHNSILSSIKTTMYEKSLETEEHAERLADLSEVLGRQLGMHGQELLDLKLFAMLHDIGKIGIDERVLTKREKLTDDDWLEIRKHPEIGYRITHATADLKDISDYILYHHERWDGRGYPLGLAGNDIPLLSRVLSVVDSYDAMTNDRVYRKALSEQDAVAEIVRNSGSQFDPAITEIFVQVILNAAVLSPRG
jgi:diguanylate cyclase (GGDEF)-like protein/PAS domain S-box-containing protein